jgi:hypothetical protein
MVLWLLHHLNDTGTANATAVSAGGTHIIDAELDAVFTADCIFNLSEDGSAPILPDGNILEGLFFQANSPHFVGRTEVLVQGIKVVAKGDPIETTPGKVVLVAAQVVKRFKHLASQLGKRVFFFKFTTRIHQGFITSSFSGGQDGAEKEGKVHGEELHDDWVGR